MHTYVLNIDIPNYPELKIEAGLPNDGKGTPWYGMQPMSQQAAGRIK